MANTPRRDTPESPDHSLMERFFGVSAAGSTPLRELRAGCVTFLTMSFIAFATASFWGIFAVAIPIVLPLAQALDASMPLVIGALISASAFGSHTCFYGDATVLSAKVPSRLSNLS